MVNCSSMCSCMLDDKRRYCNPSYHLSHWVEWYTIQTLLSFVRFIHDSTLSYYKSLWVQDVMIWSLWPLIIVYNSPLRMFWFNMRSTYVFIHPYPKIQCIVMMESMTDMQFYTYFLITAYTMNGHTAGGDAVFTCTCFHCLMLHLVTGWGCEDSHNLLQISTIWCDRIF